MGRVWVGADPGGKEAFGVATVDERGNMHSSTVSSVADAMDWIIKATDGKKPGGLGIDAPMWWSAAPGAGRRADRRLRKAYGIRSGTVQSVNSLRGAVVVGGALLASRMREEFHETKITESHPKALLEALDLDVAAFQKRFSIQDIRLVWDKEEHQRDAVVAAVCAREGLQGNWPLNLADDRDGLEQDPTSYWLEPVSYWWPELID